MLIDKYIKEFDDQLKQIIEESKAPWEKPNPKKKHHNLTPEQKNKAKARAKSAGRPYPNLVDNMAVSKK